MLLEEAMKINQNIFPCHEALSFMCYQIDFVAFIAFLALETAKRENQMYFCFTSTHTNKKQNRNETYSYL